MGSKASDVPLFPIVPQVQWRRWFDLLLLAVAVIAVGHLTYEDHSASPASEHNPEDTLLFSK